MPVLLSYEDFSNSTLNALLKHHILLKFYLDMRKKMEF